MHIGTKRIRFASVALLSGVLATTGCGILDVSNPNNLVEENLATTQAANAVVNGALSLAAVAISDVWQAYEIAGDGLTWIGSRDGWREIDIGALSNTENEFLDVTYPELAQARWMADQAVDLVKVHVDEGLTQFNATLAKGYLIAGTVYTVIGEVQEDMTFSDKLEAGAPVGEAGMLAVFDDAVSRLDQAVTLARAAGNSEIETRALAMRARAKFAKGIRQKIKPTPNTANPLVQDAGAVADAQAALALMGGTDWRWQFQYSASTITNQLASWINSRAENQVGSDYVSVDPAAIKTITGIVLMDPLTNAPDREITRRVNEFFVEGQIYQPLTIIDERQMHMIIAEDALARGDNAAFTDAINDIRVTLDGVTAYSGQIPAIDMLRHERRVNIFLTGQRLADMYRFGVVDDVWLPTSDTQQNPGKLLPISITEIRANCHLNGLGC
ncbi:MAG: hypothetical protein KC645_06395 [Gemmatimonadetes bacterium]|nr:hypothetical protein [Gemmatimonadota bacterium]